MIRRIAATVALATIGFLAIGIVPASASPRLHLDRHDISARQCSPGAPHTKKVVDVNYVIYNDSDSGFGGNSWANDTIDRNVRIWQQPGNTYCVQVADVGSFVTYAGTSPGGTKTVSQGVRGTIQGGYITSDVTGTFAPTLRTSGYLGAFNLKCDISDNCTGTSPSWKSYFTNPVGNEFAQWGWIYNAGRHGTWLNQDNVTAANSGDITG